MMVDPTERIAALEVHVPVLHDDMKELREDIREIKATLESLRDMVVRDQSERMGSHKTLVAFGTFTGAVASGITYAAARIFGH